MAQAQAQRSILVEAANLAIKTIFYIFGGSGELICVLDWRSYFATLLDSATVNWLRPIKSSAFWHCGAQVVMLAQEKVFFRGQHSGHGMTIKPQDLGLHI
jgi:hypothetical protein